jgi:predicted metalloprotease
MKSPKNYQSENVNDVRDGRSGMGSGRGFGGASLGTALIPIIGSLMRTKSGRIVLLVLVVVFIFGGSQFGNIFSSSGGGLSQIGQNYEGFNAPNNDQLQNAKAPTDEEGIFVSFVLDDINGYWEEVFTTNNESYSPSQLNIFDGDIQSGCGLATSDVGPFYCPADSQTYIDLIFFNQLESRFGASGDFAQAYVIAHEIGHHVQNLLGTNAQVERLKSQRGSNSNQLSVRVELQADCLAGVWANSANARGLLEVGDIEEAINAASKIGDDNIQRQSGQTVDQESFTHGSSTQRKEWLTKGFRSGNAETCDTFESAI